MLVKLQKKQVKITCYNIHIESNILKQNLSIFKGEDNYGENVS